MKVIQVVGEAVRTRNQGDLALWSQIGVERKWQVLPKGSAALAEQQAPHIPLSRGKGCWGSTGSVVP